MKTKIEATKIGATKKEKLSIWSKRENSLIHFNTMEEVEVYVTENTDDIMMLSGHVVVIKSLTH